MFVIVYGYKIINKSCKVLYVGDRDPKKALNIIIKGNKVKIDVEDWKNVLGHFTGKVTLYENKPTIIITEEYQLATKIDL